MGNCLTKKNKTFIIFENNENENSINELNNYIEENLKKIDEKILNKYGRNKIIKVLEAKWWEKKTKIKYFEEEFLIIEKEIFIK